MPPNRNWRTKISDQLGLVWMGLYAILVVLSIGVAAVFQKEYFRSGSWEWLISLGLLHFGLVILSERGLAGVIKSTGRRMRMAFLFSLGIGIGVFILLQVRRNGFPMPALWMRGLFGIYSVSAFCSAFAGGLTATWRQLPIWEDNYPPALEIRAAVLRHHQWVDELPEVRDFWKRAFDLILSASGLLLSFPIWFICIFLIWFEDPGPVLFIKNSVGKGGFNFRQLKLRTMVYNAEAFTGPVLSPEHDRRVLHSGRLFRKTALDELPQLINILKGEMSFVGPRPQRTILVNEYLERMPEYAFRHLVLPGLAGLAQVAGDYYLTPRQKLRFDRLYIQHMSLGFDLRLLILAFLIAFWFRWQKGWNGRLPRRWLHFSH